MPGLQHPLCIEKHPLNSCVQLASGWRAYGTSGFSSGISGDPTTACCVYHPDPSLGSLSHQASCPQSVPQQREGEAWGCTQDPANLGCPTSHQESTQWRECLAGLTTTPAAAGGGTPIHWDEGAPCLQRHWRLRTEHYAPGTAGCWEQAVCSGAGKLKITLQRYQGSPRRGVWRVVPMAGGSSSASHIHVAPRESCGCCW